MSKNSTNGFGIIECLISILLLTFIMVGGMSFYIYSNSYIKVTTYKRIASDLANSKMEEIKQAGFSGLHETWDPCVIDTSHSIASLPVNATITTCVVDNRTDCSPPCKYYKQVAVNVTWNQPGQSTPQSIRLDSFIAQE